MNEYTRAIRQSDEHWAQHCSVLRLSTHVIIRNHQKPLSPSPSFWLRSRPCWLSSLSQFLLTSLSGYAPYGRTQFIATESDANWDTVTKFQCLSGLALAPVGPSEGPDTGQISATLCCSLGGIADWVMENSPRGHSPEGQTNISLPAFAMTTQSDISPREGL